MSTLIPIPQPPGKIFIGNLGDVDSNNPVKSLVGLIKQYGDIVQLNIVGREFVIAGSQKVVHELCDQSRFQKIVSGALAQVRELAGDGLFTAHGSEPNWGIAHRVLIPAFGPIGIREMFPGMIDIASQLVTKWHRFGNARVDVVTDFTRLTLDTIALCTFSHRFNSFYSEDPPPFVEAMARSLKTSGGKTRRVPGSSFFYKKTDQQYADDIRLQHDIADGLIQERIDSGEDRGDLLDAMLKGRDPTTGQGLTPENIRYQLVTFLIAGHETTSGLLSFLFHFLLKNPRAAHAIRQEVDHVCGREAVTYENLQKLKYVDAALKETLRLKSTAPAFSVTPIKDTETIESKYEIKKGMPVLIVLDALHRDPNVWGDDAEDFRPERMLDGKFEALPPDSWKPFGSGVRACIGRPFAWQESLLVVAMLFQNFDFLPHNLKYELEIKSSLTIKPANFYMHVSPRKDAVLPSLPSTSTQPSTKNVPTEVVQGGPPLGIFYGSNAGTCRALAYKLLDTASRRGFSATVNHLNDIVPGTLPVDKPIAIVTASYEGQPTDDANFFFEWVKTAGPESAQGVRYAVFGCGHPDWAATFHAIPQAIDTRLENCGARRLVPRGKGNAAAAELFEQFDEWEESFLSAISDGSTAGATESRLDVKIDSEMRVKLLQHDFMQTATVVSNEIITRGHTAIKRHIVIQLPDDSTYRSGDYLGLLPLSPLPTIHRALNRFNLHADDILTLSGSGKSFCLPMEQPISAFDVFGSLVELSQPVSVKMIASLLPLAEDEDKAFIERCIQPGVYECEIAQSRVSLLDLLEQLPGVHMPLGDFLLALPPLRMRQYSISSSPLDNPTRVALTVSVLDSVHLSNKGRFLGTASNYLAHLLPGSRIRAAVRPSQEAFHPPLDPKVPIILVGSGSGIAPFRAFCQERALQKSSGRDVGSCLLFYGCHSRDTDALYDDEMSAWKQLGVVDLKYAFSRAPEDSEGCKHVQDRIYHDRIETMALFKQGAKIFVCGSNSLANGVRDVIVRLYCEDTGKTEEEGHEWLRSIQSSRFATDIFG